MTIITAQERMTTGFYLLIVDDEPNIRSGLAKGLAREADFIETAQDVNDALEKFSAGKYQLVIADRIGRSIVRLVVGGDFVTRIRPGIAMC